MKYLIAVFIGCLLLMWSVAAVRVGQPQATHKTITLTSEIYDALHEGITTSEALKVAGIPTKQESFTSPKGNQTDKLTWFSSHGAMISAQFDNGVLVNKNCIDLHR